MRLLVTSLLTIFFFSLQAQKGVPHNELLPDELFPAMKEIWLKASDAPESGAMDAEAAKDLVKQKAGYNQDVELELAYTRQSKIFTHYHFDLLYKNTPLLGGDVHIAISAEGRPKLIQYPDFPLSGELKLPGTQQAEHVRQMLQAEKIIKAEPVLTYQGRDQLKAALRVELAGPEHLHREVVYSDGEIIYNNDLHKHLGTSLAGPNDTTVSVQVFDPDPLTTAEQGYAGNYKDNNDQNNGALNTERKTRNTTFTFDNGLFKPENDFLKITEFSAPVTSPAVSASRQFNYTRDKAEFEDVNVMYHITQQAEYLQKIGYPNLPSYQVQVDAHALNGSDQSFFSTTSFPYRLYFGEGGVDDAEDADVVLHEFCHAVIYETAPNGSKNTERKCIEEAICDYFAVGYSRSVSSFNSNQVFNWDGHNEFWPGRSVSSNKNYGQASFKNGNYYAHTDLFSSALLDIYESLGRQMADQLVIEASYFLTSTTTMPQFARYMIMSDSMMTSASNIRTVSDAFFQRGVLDEVISAPEFSLSDNRFEITDTYGFARGQSLKVSYSEGLKAYRLYDLKGQVIMERSVAGQESVEISSAALRPGIYILKVLAEDGRQTSLKLSRMSH